MPFGRGAPTSGTLGILPRLNGPRVSRPAAPVDWLIVGLGNPGGEYVGSPHNIGFEIANALAQRWDLPRAKQKYRGLLTDGRTGPGGPRVAVLLPQTYMNEAGRSVGPARGALKLDDLSHVLVLHDEIDLPFGEIRTRVGGGLAGHNGLKSLKKELGSADFARVRVGVGRPPTTDPDRVAAYVLGRFREPRDQVADLIDRAAGAAERVVLGTEELLSSS
jgi:PTH1 family peptidyl-tRNA hydrolase